MDKPSRILVVDDNEDIRITMKAILENEGYQVDLATTGNEAIQKTEKMTFSAVLIDIRLPDMEGVKLLELMKDGEPKTRKIIVTGFPTIQNAAASVDKKADAYLIKPVDLTKLLKTIKEQIQLRENEEKFNKQIVAQFIETRVMEYNANPP